MYWRVGKFQFLPQHQSAPSRHFLVALHSCHPQEPCSARGGRPQNLVTQGPSEACCIASFLAGRPQPHSLPPGNSIADSAIPAPLHFFSASALSIRQNLVARWWPSAGTCNAGLRACCIASFLAGRPTTVSAAPRTPSPLEVIDFSAPQLDVAFSVRRLSILKNLVAQLCRPQGPCCIASSRIDRPITSLVAWRSPHFWVWCPEDVCFLLSTFSFWPIRCPALRHSCPQNRQPNAPSNPACEPLPFSWNAFCPRKPAIFSRIFLFVTPRSIHGIPPALGVPVQ